MRRFRRPATVTLDKDGLPTTFTAWGHTFGIVAQEEHWWLTERPWWTPENLGKPLDELQVRHYKVRANGVQRSAVVELVCLRGEWFVVGVED
ncbi:hypothetical protein [Microtetraspora malaysiensis]|uniref:Nucleotidyltransferase n=1 Tax=Microtetraspora malaysiensis TaxID=161358 RepID=A0ABW6SKG8_9ACTN